MDEGLLERLRDKDPSRGVEHPWACAPMVRARVSLTRGRDCQTTPTRTKPGEAAVESEVPDPEYDPSTSVSERRGSAGGRGSEWWAGLVGVRMRTFDHVAVLVKMVRLTASS